MFMKRMKHALTKPQDLNFDLEYKIVDSGLVAICIIFMQYLISVEKPDELQTVSLVFFSIAIPFLAVHFFISQTMDDSKHPVSVSAYLAKSFEAIFLLGVFCTDLGILFALTHSSWIVSTVFMASCAFATFMAAFIKKDYLKSIKIEIKNKEIEIGNLELERERLKTEQRDLELEHENLKAVISSLELEMEKRGIELERDSTMKI